MFLIKYLVKEQISDTNGKLFQDADVTQQVWRHMNDSVYKSPVPGSNFQHIPSWSVFGDICLEWGCP